MDYISLLPKEIVHAHILRKLSIKEAARTSVLSKWWNSLWSSLPYLEFYHNCHLYNTRGFRDIVDQTLRDRKRTETDILKFKLFVSHGIQPSDIDNWVSLVMERNVQKFNLIFSGCELYKWPSHKVSIAKTITVLKLNHCEVEFNSIMKLPHLQILSLENVLIDERSIQIFISGCPYMNDLKVWNCYGLEHLNVANHQLKRVLVGYCSRLKKIDITQVPSLQSLRLYFTESFMSLDPSIFKIDSRAYEMLRELRLCNYSRIDSRAYIDDRAFQDLLSAISNLECLILYNVRQYSQNIRISSKTLKRLVLEDCDFLMFDICAPNLTSLKYENNRMLFYPVETYNVQDYIFSNCCHYSTGPEQKSLKFETVKKFLMNSRSNKLWKGTRMVLDLTWCNYPVVFEDWTSIAQLPYEVVDGLFPTTMCISNMSFPQLAEWFLLHSFGEKLLVISSADSKLYKALKKKRPSYYCMSSTFTMTREAFERNSRLLPMNRKFALLFDALLEERSKPMQAIVLERKAFEE